MSGPLVQVFDIRSGRPCHLRNTAVHAKMKFLVLVSNGVSRKSVPISVGTLFEFWGVCVIIDLCPRQL